MKALKSLFPAMSRGLRQDFGALVAVPFHVTSAMATLLGHAMPLLRLVVEWFALAGLASIALIEFEIRKEFTTMG